ncbi:hypothetical protein L1049_010154 [Liquidambar formosana]|uniref:Uncharacterized protein n=1 Tax=Liquidambar formosana TaxID=63359 RepID=A0AAP0R6T1_LIQFO
MFLYSTIPDADVDYTPHPIFKRVAFTLAPYNPQQKSQALHLQTQSNAEGNLNLTTTAASSEISRLVNTGADATAAVSFSNLVFRCRTGVSRFL